MPHSKIGTAMQVTRNYRHFYHRPCLLLLSFTKSSTIKGGKDWDEILFSTSVREFFKDFSPFLWMGRNIHDFHWNICEHFYHCRTAITRLAMIGNMNISNITLWVLKFVEIIHLIYEVFGGACWNTSKTWIVNPYLAWYFWPNPTHQCQGILSQKLLVWSSNMMCGNMATCF